MLDPVDQHLIRPQGPAFVDFLAQAQVRNLLRLGRIFQPEGDEGNRRGGVEEGGEAPRDMPVTLAVVLFAENRKSFPPPLPPADTPNLQRRIERTGLRGGGPAGD